MKRRIFLQAMPALISMAPIARSQTGYPSKPIRYIVPVATGGGSDMVGRTVTERWAKVLGQSIVVENQGGGGGVIASQNTVRATPDGYTLMQGYVATHGTAPATRKLPYDPVRSFTPIGMIGSTPIRRHSALTDVPTLEEVGYAGFNAVQWYGVVGPAGIPPEIVRRLSETLATVLKAPDLRDKLSVEAVEPMLMSPEQFGRYIIEDVARWSRLAQSRGIQLDG